MKKLFVAIVCLSICGTVQAQQKQVVTTAQSTPTPDPKAGKLVFESDSHDFGEVKEGPGAEYDFVFTNKGKSPVVISNAHASCGCTVPQWPKEPVLPGKKGTIHVTYNTSGRVGPFTKQVFVASNAQEPNMTLNIKGTVKAKDADAANQK